MQWFDHYASRFDTVERNAPFYSWPTVATALERFGPVHAVKPVLVFELNFDGIQRCNRHKTGIAVRFPRMARWRHDKKPQDADTVDSIRKLVTG